MKQNSIIVKIISALLCMTIVFIGMGGFAPETHAKSLDSLKDEQSDIRDKIKDSEAEIEKLEKQQAAQEKIINELNKQINHLNSQLNNVNSQQAVVNSEITETQAKIAQLDEEIRQLDIQIAQKDQEIKDTIELFCERMRANYMAGETSVLELFTASSSLSSFFNRLELFRRVTTSDQELIDELNREIAEIEKMQQELEDKKVSVEAEKARLEVKKGDLQQIENELNATQSEIIAKSKEVNQKLADLNYQTKKLEVSISKYNDEMDKIDAEIEEFLKQQQASSGNAGSANSNITSKGWQWPVPYSNSYITSPYGYRSDPISGAYKFHAGIDISMAGAHGKKLVATKGGTVIRAVHSNSGYGNYVMIDHGGGFASLYAHCSSLAVSVGQKVSQGQVIAYIGSSGYSTGPHVHFEIRYNGEKVNPSNYVSK